MKYEPIANYIPLLTQWAQARQLAILTGAGVSMLPPSSLPSWWELTISAYRAMAGDTPKFQAHLSHIEMLNLQSAVLAQYLWDVVGDEYFSSLDVLKNGVPNANHHLIALLAKAQFISQIFTLNFDTLHEESFTRLGINHQVLLNGDVPETKLGALNLHKLHGTITDHHTIRATLDQTTSRDGVGKAQKQRLGEHRKEHHLLVLGYSGGDFFLDVDYLGLISHHSQSRIIWNVRPGEITSDEHPLLKLAKICPEVTICEGLLPDLLNELASSCGVSNQATEQLSIRSAPSQPRKEYLDYAQWSLAGALVCKGL